MSDAAIRVENLGKLYRIGAPERYKALRDTLTDAFAKPFRLVRNLFSGNGGSPPDSSDNTIWALKDVSFEVKRGEVIGIIGRNGAGKSTLLKILSRITEPTEGFAELRGRVGSLLEVGTGFHPELTGRENIYLNGAILGMYRSEINRKFDEIVAFAEVEKFIDTPVKHYSSGMYLRLAFAVAAHLEPEILLVDEVLAVGDAAFQKKCLGKIGEVAQEGRTVLLVSHNMTSIEALCPHAFLIESGLLIENGLTKDIIKKYLANMIEKSQNLILSETTRNIKSIRIKNFEGNESDKFFVDDDIFFEIDLFHETFLDSPRLSISIYSLRGERLLTIHTDIQQKEKWSFQGTKRVKAIWKNNRLVPNRYRVDVSLWGFSSEIEYLPGCKEIKIQPRDIYGTGVLPNPSFQGYFLPDASWEIN